MGFTGLVPALGGEWSKAGQQRTEEEKAAMGRLEKGTGYGLTEADRRGLLKNLMEPIKQEAQQARQALSRQSLAQGPFGSGQMARQVGQIQEKIAKAFGEAGMKIARYGSERAKQDEERDRAMRDQRIARITSIWKAGMPGSGAPAMTGKGFSDPSAAGAGEGEDDPTTGDDESLQTDTGQTALKVATTIASDVRLKEDIDLIGQSDSGLNIYEFSYIGCDGRYRGVMAQELLSSVPEAVVRMSNGYFGVVYDLLDVDFMVL